MQWLRRLFAAKPYRNLAVQEMERMLTEVRAESARANARLAIARETGACTRELEDAAAYAAQAVAIGERSWATLRRVLRAHGHDIGEVPPVDELLVRGEVEADAECG